MKSLNDKIKTHRFKFEQLISVKLKLFQSNKDEIIAKIEKNIDLFIKQIFITVEKTNLDVDKSI